RRMLRGRRRTSRLLQWPHQSSPRRRRALNPAGRRNQRLPPVLLLPCPAGRKKLRERQPEGAPLHRLISIGLLFCIVGTARAEMLQSATPEGMKSWPKLNAPADWHQDQESSQRLNANFLIPDGVDPANAEVSIQARGFPRTNNSLSNLLENDRAASPGTEV